MFKYHEEIEVGDETPEVTLTLKLISKGTKERGQFGPPEFYDPGSDPELEVIGFAIGTLNFSYHQMQVLLGEEALKKMMDDAETFVIENLPEELY